MAYPNDVVREFCHRHHVWKAYDGRKIVAFHRDEDTLKAIAPNGIQVRPSETSVRNGDKVRCVCRSC